jgi:hypothetical protein
MGSEVSSGPDGEPVTRDASADEILFVTVAPFVIDGRPVAGESVDVA